MSADTNSTANQPPKDMIGVLDYYLVQKAPFQLPDAIKEILVKFGPWIALILLILSLPALFLVLGLSVTFLPFGAAGYCYGLLWSVAFCLQLALMGFALPGLFARKMSGWTLMFYAQVISVVASLLSWAIVGALIGGLISFYILFQIRSLYKN